MFNQFHDGNFSFNLQRPSCVKLKAVHKRVFELKWARLKVVWWKTACGSSPRKSLYDRPYPQEYTLLLDKLIILVNPNLARSQSRNRVRVAIEARPLTTLLALTFWSTLSDSFSRLTILMATFLPVTQWTPSLTKPAIKNAPWLIWK